MLQQTCTCLAYMYAVAGSGMLPYTGQVQLCQVKRASSSFYNQIAANVQLALHQCQVTDQKSSKAQIAILLLEALEVKNAQNSILTFRQLL